METLTIEDFKKHMNTASRMQAADVEGNTLTIYFNGRIELAIVSEGGRKRNIGYIKDNYLYVHREETHLHFKSNSLGFNYILLKHTSIFDYVMIDFRDFLYRVPKATILSHGNIMNFKNSKDGNSFELQIFLNLNFIKPFQVVPEN